MPPKGSDYEANILSEETDLAMMLPERKAFQGAVTVSAKAL